MKKLRIHLDIDKLVIWYKKHTGIEVVAVQEDEATFETIVKDFIVEQIGQNYSDYIAKVQLRRRLGAHVVWDVDIEGDGPEFMKACRGISEVFA